MLVLDICIHYEIKDNVIDFLLQNGYSDFFFIEAKKYVTKNMLLSNTERVTGRQECALITIYLERTAANGLAGLLKETFTGIEVFAIECQTIVS
ncbi:DUF3240 domain-containing protein [Helicobacter aurati]|uniref:DUF3240 domain-containing protein n=1 Tax=Helicobacter aurati TaxID=137778 RepID=A0A3D8J9C1_9HELI|nr:DUF3240 family protein [Helicobacter aurati]RDU73464.1 DUF3240 domain-containing protein [Helicobacter aurati]